MRRLRPFLASCLLLGSLAGVTGCDPSTGVDLAMDQYAGGFRLVDRSYAAADALMVQSKNVLQPTTPLLMGTLNDINKMETSTPLGRMIMEQVGARFVQKGFVVSDVRFRNAINVKESAKDQTEGGEFFLSRDTSVLRGEQDVGAVVTGTYVLSKMEVIVNLRLIEASSSRIIAAYDYRMPMTSDIRALVTRKTDFYQYNSGTYESAWY